MRIRTAIRPLIAAAFAAAACLAAAPGAATAGESGTTWLCGPGVKNDPCRNSLTATTVDAAGKKTGTERTRLAKKPAVDCFYVYPTTSDDEGPQADFSIDPELRAIALFQASRFSEHCRVFAPVYRQITLRGLLQPTTVTDAMREQAYADVVAAWDDYLKNHNGTRGVVVIGHSQGASVLRRLVAERIDPRTSTRRRLVSALLIGSRVAVPKGEDVGGDFKRVPACRKDGQTGCVIAYNAFDEAVPAESRFGRVPEADRDKLENLCTNPANLAKPTKRTRLSAYNSTFDFPGTIGALIDIMQPELPTVSTPWIAAPRSYTGRCLNKDDAVVLRVSGKPDLTPAPDRTWGLHLADMNLPMGDLTDAVERQAAAYEKRR